ncbi:hypothetical protein FNV43_RR06136 [Rhamnella rubrinervis]|uniref:Uncharacterized protein n=1 Tax=Rhamnella rubrinervis TaxID=2594499 RepID=A0A8K0HCI5_9ROSA|nr:hypothetical protein FNV43_RR06136 [Rhamnella rubrinervis]
MVQTRSLTVPIIHDQALVQMLRLKPLSNPLGNNASGKKLTGEWIFGKEAQKAKLKDLEEEEESACQGSA